MRILKFSLIACGGNCLLVTIYYELSLHFVVLLNMLIIMCFVLKTLSQQNETKLCLPEDSLECYKIMK